MPPARPKRSTIPPDEALPPLPPLDGDEGEETPRDELFDEPLPPEAGGDEDEGPLSAEDIDDLGDEAWLGEPDEDDSLDVGDPADEIDVLDGTWVDDGRDANSEGDDELGTADEGATSDDRGEEGPEHDAFDSIDEAGPLDDAGDAEDGAHEDTAELPPTAEREPEAFALPAPVSSRWARVVTEGPVFAAARRGSSVVFAGASVYHARVATLEALGARPIVARRLAHPTDELLSSLAATASGALVVATVGARLLRSDEGGTLWESLSSLGGDDDAARAPVELFAETSGTRERLWARAHGGGLYRSDDGGARWEGSVLEAPVRAVAVDPRGGLIAATSGRGAGVLRSTDGQAFRPLALRVDAPPTAMACLGDVLAFAFARGPGLVSVDGGATAVAWGALTGASALCLVETDDGAVQLVAGIADEHGERATLLAAGVAGDGGARGTRRIADVEALLGPSSGAHAEEADARIESLLPLDAAGRRLVLITPRGVLVVARDEG